MESPMLCWYCHLKCTNFIFMWSISFLPNTFLQELAFHDEEKARNKQVQMPDSIDYIPFKKSKDLPAYESCFVSRFLLNRFKHPQLRFHDDKQKHLVGDALQSNPRHQFL